MVKAAQQKCMYVSKFLAVGDYAVYVQVIQVWFVRKSCEQL